MAGKRVHFVMPDDLVSRIDAALSEGVSRGEFVRRAVEQALGEFGETGATAAAPTNSAPPESVTPAPAEQPRDETRWRPGSPEERLLGIRSSSQSKRDVRPIPKGKS